LDSVTKTYGMELKSVKPRISADRPSGTYPGGFETTLSVADPTDSDLSAYYTEDGSDPSDARNPNRDAFSGSQSFTISGNGNHAIRCYARNSGGHETQETFAWCIDDPHLPQTTISPSNGGLYLGGVEVQLSTSEPCQWTKYTTDGTHPSDDNGITNEAPFTLERTTLVKFRSKDTQGNLEPVRTARFTITRKDLRVEFHSRLPLCGHVKADTDGRNTYVSTCPHPAIGSGQDGKDHRAILHFDTSALPDNARVRKACLALTRFADSGDVWKEGRSIAVDIQTGYLGTSQALQADDWNAPATAPNVASVEKFSSGGGRSSDFSQAGCDAINTTGVTQVRLRCDPPHATPNNHLFIRGEARLVVEYSLWHPKLSG
jgi:hypothetical protein